jgi:TIR domain
VEGLVITMIPDASTSGADQPKVFVSHSSADKPFLRMLVKLLRLENITVWLDELELRPGDVLLDRITSQVASVACVIAAISEDSLKSRWVHTELMVAMSLELTGKGPRVIPIKIDDCEVPPYLASRLYADFSQLRQFESAFGALVEAIKSDRPLAAVTAHDEMEEELAHTTLRDTDLRLVTQLCANIHAAARNVLLTSYHFNPNMIYRRVPGIRVLLFTVHERFACLRLQLYVSDTSVVVHCRHRFTLDPERQAYLNPAAAAWHNQRLHSIDYNVEYASDPEGYIEEAVQHGFDRAKVANILVHVASSVSIPVSRLILHSLDTSFPAVVCIDSERRGVFPEPAHPVLAEVVASLVEDYNTGRRSPWQFEDRDFQTDNRGIIDEVSDAQ